MVNKTNEGEKHVRGVSDATWGKLRAFAAMENVQVGEALSVMITYAWGQYMNGEKLATAAESDGPLPERRGGHRRSE
ncbi:MAG: hypothetical protein H0U76_14000 [Ktedonobacteraceae bacterium]|nr:hypothetical protein [Ktedonobacteraceae bacterium]